MSVTAISSQYINAQALPPIKTPLRVKNTRGDIIGYVDIEGGFPWAGWMNGIGMNSRAVSVKATIDWGTIGANSFKSELVSFGPTLLTPTTPISVDSGITYYVIPRIPAAGGGLIFGGEMVLPYEIKAFVYNYTVAPVTPGPLDMDFLIVPRIA